MNWRTEACSSCLVLQNSDYGITYHLVLLPCRIARPCYYRQIHVNVFTHCFDLPSGGLPIF